MSGPRRPRRTLADFVKPEPTPDQALAYAICQAVYPAGCSCEARVLGPCDSMRGAAMTARNIVNQQRKPGRD